MAGRHPPRVRGWGGRIPVCVENSVVVGRAIVPTLFMTSRVFFDVAGVHRGINWLSVGLRNDAHGERRRHGNEKREEDLHDAAMLCLSWRLPGSGSDQAAVGTGFGGKSPMCYVISKT